MYLSDYEATIRVDNLLAISESKSEDGRAGLTLIYPTIKAEILYSDWILRDRMFNRISRYLTERKSE